MKLIAPIDWGDFQITLIYRFCVLAFWTIKISFRVDGLVKIKIAFVYLYSKRATVGSRYCYVIDRSKC